MSLRDLEACRGQRRSWVSPSSKLPADVGASASRGAREFSHQTSSIFRGKLGRFAQTWAAEDMKSQTRCCRRCLKDDDDIVVFAAQLGPSAAGWGPVTCHAPQGAPS
jgi:hypothetical protein